MNRDHAPNPPVEVAESRFTAALYDPFVWLGEKLGMAARRRDLLKEAHGSVLEIGAGTGLNLRHYPAGLEELVLVEPGEPMADRVDLSRAPDGVPARLVRAPAEHLPFAEGTFDTVVSTLVLCTVSDPARAVSEAARVLKPGGRLLFCEHVGRSRVGGVHCSGARRGPGLPSLMAVAATARPWRRSNRRCGSSRWSAAAGAECRRS